MGFKILVRGACPEFRKQIDQTFDFDETQFQLVFCDYLYASDDDPQSLADVLAQELPSVVINAAIFDDLDASILAHEEKTLRVLVDYCREKQRALLHLSSYRVFGVVADIGANGWGEKEKCHPDDAIAQAYIALEHVVAGWERHCVIRTSWLLDGGQQSLFNAVVPALIEGDLLVASDHVFGRPLTMSFLANLCAALAQQALFGAENWGVFHAHSSDRCSEAEFCDQLVRLLSVEFDRDIAQPEIAVKGDARSLMTGQADIVGQRLMDNFGIQLPSWRSGIKTLLRNWLDLRGLRSEV